ncbi:MAG: DUF2218 domain-containing protein [Aurantimonas coralicida]
MSQAMNFSLHGEAIPTNGNHMLDEVCDHFVEHSKVERNGDRVTLTSELGTASIHLVQGRLLIALDCPTQESLDLSRNALAEHLFYFAGEEPFELTWRAPPVRGALPNLHDVTVVSTAEITPRMRRVTFRCADIAPFVGGAMHVRLLVPPQGREPVWPHYRADGRIGWPEGEDELLVRIYTIRAVDAERGELSIDFFQHPASDVQTPGADFARDARPGDRAAILGPGGGGLPAARSIFVAGDESALPAIARIAAEAPEGTRMQAIIEVEDEGEEQPLLTEGSLEIRWLHRKEYPTGMRGALAEAAGKAIADIEPDTFVWIGCEKADVRFLRDLLKRRNHDRKKMYAAWYWERTAGPDASCI